MLDRHHEVRDRGNGDGRRQWETAAARGKKKGLTCGAHKLVTGKR
jgi:hypothetical protein